MYTKNIKQENNFELIMSLGHLHVCRLCASPCENSVPIFEKTGLLNFAEKIKSYLHVEITNSNEADGPRMCDACYKKIINWDQYAEQVQKVQGMFLSMREETKAGEDFNLEVVLNEKSDILEKSKKTVMSMEKKKQKKSKKVKKVENQDSEFSEEDEIPLSNHRSTNDSTGLQKRVKEKEPKTVKPKIKLKIKPIKEDEPEPEPEPTKLDEETDMKDNKYGENDLDDNDDESDSKDENKVKVKEVQSKSSKRRLLNWICLECQTPLKTWNALVKHCKEIHNTNASVECMCGKFLQSRASIMKHRLNHTVGYRYKCEFENCNKIFHRQQLLDVHSLSHMPKELQPWMCCKCSRRFHTESLLKQHEKVHLPKEEKLIYPCEVCQKKFCSKSAVTAHIRAVHFGERPFVCDQCGHSFTSKGILQEHLTIHSDVYNFHCKDCNKSFKTKYRLKIHMDTHVETRYQCPICTLTLNTRRTLRMHLLVHRDDKAFQCTTCGKAFKRSKDLKNHYNLHTGRRPYSCPFCQRTFANGSNCRSHKRRMHPEELKMYDAALAAGQQPVILKAEDQQGTESRTHLQLVNDSNDTKTGVKYSDMNEKHVLTSQENEKADGEGKLVCRLPVPLNLQMSDERIKEEVDEEEEGLVDSMGLNGGKNITTNEKADGEGKLVCQLPVPLNLQMSDETIKEKDDEEEEGLVDSMGLNGGENITTNIAQLAFGSLSQTVQYPIQSFYTFQSSGIPAFPGNPSFRQ